MDLDLLENKSWHIKDISFVFVLKITFLCLLLDSNMLKRKKKKSKGNNSFVSKYSKDEKQESVSSICFRFLTFNVWGLPWPISRKSSRFKDIASYSPQTGADVICFQEVFSSEPIKQLSTMSEYPYHCWGSEAGNGQLSSGLLIVSKHPIKKTDSFVFECCGGGLDTLARKGVLYAEIHPQNKNNEITLHVFNTHLDSGEDRKAEETRVNQVDELMQFVKLQMTPKKEQADEKRVERNDLVLVMGDFNCEPGSKPHHLMQQIPLLSHSITKTTTLTDTENVYYLPTFPETNQRLDYVFTASLSSSFIIKQSGLVFREKVKGRFLSDHFAVFADIEIK